MHKQWEMMWSTCHKHGTKKNSEYPIGIDPITFCIPVECSNYWATKERKNLSLFFFLCPISCPWHIDHIISRFFTELKICHLSLFITHMTISTSLILRYAGRMSYINLVHGPAHHKSFVAQWLEHLTTVWKIIGSIPVGNSDFFFVPCSWYVDHISHFFTKG